MSYLIELKDIEKKFSMGITVLRDINLIVGHGDFVAIMGPSGSGKSTLLHIIGCLDRPTSGTYFLNNRNVLALSDENLSNMRSTQIGFVFQTFNLIQSLNVIENVELPFLYSENEEKTTRQKVLEAISEVGLAKRIHHRPSELSGGEMQRVAIARAIVHHPMLILADEPTGNLDSVIGNEILDLFVKFNKMGITIIMVTHDKDVSSYAHRTITLKNGKFIC